MNLADQAGAAFRADFNLAIQAIISNSSGPTEPSAVAFQFWADTTSGLLKIRNAANNAWITIGTLASANLGLFPLSGGTLTGQLLAFAGTVSAPGISWAGDDNSGLYWVSDNTWRLVSAGVAYLEVSAAGITFLGAAATTLVSGTTGQRPGTPSNGMIRYNTTTNSMDIYANGAWGTVPTVSAYPFTTTDLASTVEGVPLRNSDFSGNPSTPIFLQFPWSAPTKLTNPSTLPAGNGLSCAITPNGEYVAVGHSITPFVSIYKRKGTEFVKIADPATLPAGDVTGVAFSQNGEFLLCSHATTPFMTCYQRTYGTDTWTKLTNPATLPAAQGNGAAISPNGEFFAIAHSTTPFFSCYQRSGTTLTKLTNPATLPASTGSCAAWSHDGRFLAIGHATTPFVTIYERTNGTTLTKLSNPASLPASTVLGIAWSNDGAYLSCAHATSPFCTVYTRSGTAFTKMVAGNTSQFSDSADFPAGQGNGVSFSLDGSYMAVAHTTTPFISNYLLTSGKWVKQTNPATLPTGNGIGVCWQYEREMLLVAHTTTPFVTIYQTASDMGTTNVVVIKKIYREGT